MPVKCFATNCNHVSIAQGLCGKHYARLRRHGHVAQTRASDWGSREKHPAYKTWCNLRRYHHLDAKPEWLGDFWVFVSEIPEKPQGNSRAHRPDPAKPWGPDNFYWKQRRTPDANTTEHRDYMRIWQQKRRAADPDYERNASLKKYYGVDLDWYRDKLAEQNGVCAICHQPETLKIKGRVVKLAVDHCHETGVTRGLLCSKCNRGLGLLRHDPDLLLKACEYVLHHTD